MVGHGVRGKSYDLDLPSSLGISEAEGVNPKTGGKNPPKWMVKIMENPIF